MSLPNIIARQQGEMALTKSVNSLPVTVTCSRVLHHNTHMYIMLVRRCKLV